MRSSIDSCVQYVYRKQLFEKGAFYFYGDNTVNMKHELTIVIDKIENHKCRTHGKTSEIRYIDGKIQISTVVKSTRHFWREK